MIKGRTLNWRSHELPCKVQVSMDIVMTRTISWSLHFLGINHIQVEHRRTMGESASFHTRLYRALSTSAREETATRTYS